MTTAKKTTKKPVMKKKPAAEAPAAPETETDTSEMPEHGPTLVPFETLKLQSEKFTNARTTSGLSEESIGQLAKSLQDIGLNNRLIVWSAEDDNHNTVIAGQRRYRALQLLSEQNKWIRGVQKGMVPVDYKHVDEEAALLIAMADNDNREDVSTYERAEELYTLHVIKGIKQSKLVANSKKVSKGQISKLINTFTHACDRLKDLWRAGMVAFDNVQKIVKSAKDDSEKQVTLLDEYLATLEEGGDRKKKGDARKKLEGTKREARGFSKSDAAYIADSVRTLLLSMKEADPDAYIIPGTLAVWSLLLVATGESPTEEDSLYNEEANDLFWSLFADVFKESEEEEEVEEDESEEDEDEDEDEDEEDEEDEESEEDEETEEESEDEVEDTEDDAEADE